MRWLLLYAAAARRRHPADEAEWKQLQEFLFSRAMEHDSPRLLFRLA